MDGKGFSFALVFFALSLLGAKAQEDLPGYDHYTVKDGLPAQTIYNLLQDRNGFVWVTSDAGVSRFDGKNFINYTTENGLGDNEVLSLYEDKKGRIWFTPFGIHQSYYYNGKLYSSSTDSLLKTLAQYGVIVNPVETVEGDMYAHLRGNPHSIIKVNKANKVTCLSFSHFLDKTDVIKALYLSADKSKAFALTEAGRMILVSGSQPREVKNPYPGFSEGGSKVWCENTRDPEKILYINNKGIYTIKDTACILLLPAQKIPFSNYDEVILLMDKRKNIWVCNHRHNTFFYRHTDSGYAPFAQVLKNMFAVVAVDNEDNVWFCTGNKGLFKIPYKKLVEDVLPGIKDQLLQKNILSIHTDAEGGIWTGYSNGFITRIRGNQIKHYNLNFGSRNYNRILQIQSDKRGNIWCATDETCVLLKKQANGVYAATLLRHPDGRNYYAPVKGVLLDKAGNIYITIPKGVTTVAGPSLLASIKYSIDINSRLYSSFFDNQNTCYLSSFDGFYKVVNDTLKNLALTNPRLKVRVQHFNQNRAGTIFLATYSDGVLAVKNDTVVANLNREHGLAGIICRRVYLHNDTLYIVTNGGITIATYTGGLFNIVQNIGLDDGLHSDDVNDIAFWGNTLYAATAEGLSTFALPLQKQYPVAAPVLSILSFKVNETIYPTTATIAFPYRWQRVRVEYIAPAMVNAEMVQYRYRFAGTNEWHITSATQLEFNNLHHGDFKIEIQAKKPNSNWSPSKEIQFTILPPFYSTWMFRGLMGLCVIVVLYLIIQYRFTRRFRAQLAQLKQNEAIEKERNRIAADIHDDIGAELTHIVLLSRIIKENPNTVPLTDMVDKLEKSSNEVINKMNEVIWTLNAANHTLHNLAAYLHNYSARLLEEHGIKSDITIDDSVFVELVVKADVGRNIFLIIKETLHNIIKHSGASKVEINMILQEAPTLCFEIKDNGRGFDEQKTKGGNGLGNIHKRAEAMLGTAQIITEPGGGCVVKVRVPL